MEKLFYDDIVNVIQGATLMGGGGGGSMSAGLEMLETYAVSVGKDKVIVEMCTPDEMADGAYAAVTAGMGAPTKIPADFTPWVMNTFDFFETIEKAYGREIKYSMAVELGGFNTFVPMLVSLKKNIPFLNLDGAARAVPALPTLLFGVNGYDTLPIALADYRGDGNDFGKVFIDFPEDAKNASLAEDAARAYLSAHMNGIAGLSGWPTPKSAFDPSKLPYGSISLVKEIGSVLQSTPADDVFTKLQGIVKCRGLGRYTVVDGDNGASGGFDKGYVTFQNSDMSKDFYRIDFQNENLVLHHGPSADVMDPGPVMTAPDIICSFRTKDKVPMTNADFFTDDVVQKGLEVILGLIKVNDVWWYRGYSDVNAIWKEYFKNVGYAGDIVQFA